ncbi:hypothetical protein BJ878DRAFT_568511 [Calycina marina]|uniref:Uncharacterized protein n=1 Tax=Calycina marina TaxID=1763456 RepID=A0A9P7Z157_9HELO|nr:hypothetical protein BJ878DRAFT_568511 [Calycina marina]
MEEDDDMMEILDLENSSADEQEDEEEANEEDSTMEHKEPDHLSMLSSIFTPYVDVLNTRPANDVERMNAMIANIERQQAAVRQNMHNLVERRARLVDEEAESRMDGEQEADEREEGFSILTEDEKRSFDFKVNVVATRPNENEINKGERFMAYEVRSREVWPLPKLNPGAENHPIQERTDTMDSDGNVEMGEDEPDSSKSPEPQAARSQKKIRAEMLALVEDGKRELSDFEERANKHIRQLKKVLEKKQKENA